MTRQSPTHWRAIFDNPPLNLMGSEFVLQFKQIMAKIEIDEKVKAVI